LACWVGFAFFVKEKAKLQPRTQSKAQIT